MSEIRESRLLKANSLINKGFEPYGETFKISHTTKFLSEKFDYLMSFVFVSPNMHKVHHHSFMPYTDSNYGNIFSIWDRLFGTYMELDREKIIFGIDDNYDDKNNFINILKRPFRKP